MITAETLFNYLEIWKTILENQLLKRRKIIQK